MTSPILISEKAIENLIIQNENWEEIKEKFVKLVLKKKKTTLGVRNKDTLINK